MNSGVMISRMNSGEMSMNAGWIDSGGTNMNSGDKSINSGGMSSGMNSYGSTKLRNSSRVSARMIMNSDCMCCSMNIGCTAPGGMSMKSGGRGSSMNSGCMETGSM